MYGRSPMAVMSAWNTATGTVSSRIYNPICLRPALVAVFRPRLGTSQINNCKNTDAVI